MTLARPILFYHRGALGDGTTPSGPVHPSPLSASGTGHASVQSGPPIQSSKSSASGWITSLAPGPISAFTDFTPYTPFREIGT